MPVPDTAPGEVLRFLMERHGLHQADLPEIGSQGVVSELLSGKRQLDARQIITLARAGGPQAEGGVVSRAAHHVASEKSLVQWGAVMRTFGTHGEHLVVITRYHHRVSARVAENHRPIRQLCERGAVRN